MTAIILGGRTYKLRPLTLGQLRVILPAFARAAALGQEDSVDAAIDILEAALSRDAPEMTRAVLLDAEIFAAELIGAVDAIARLSGLVQEGNVLPGEEQASAGASSTVS
jgi:hypothetical protein